MELFTAPQTIPGQRCFDDLAHDEPFSIFSVDPDTRVAGSYLGMAEFTGTVTARRSNTMNWKRHIVNIVLDAPITTYGVEHTSICLEVESDGRDRYGSRLELA